MNENIITVYDRDGLICSCGDILYDKKGYQYIFRGVEYIEPKGVFERLVSVGKAGQKAVLSLRPSDKNNYTDTIYVELEWVKEWYSHKRFD